MPRKGLIEITNIAADSADVLIYDRIGAGFFEDGVTAKQFAADLKALSAKVKTLNVRINSPGGAVFEGVAIYNALTEHAARVIVHVDGLAGSIASVIAMAGDEIHMAANALMFIHEAAGAVRGGSEDLRKYAELLDKINAQMVDTYATRTGSTPEQIAAWMAAETWMDAKEAKARGFATHVARTSAIAASIDDQIFANAPEWVLERITAAMGTAPKPADSDRGISQDMKGPEPMTDTTTTTAAAPVQASYEQLVETCVGADAEFIVTQLKAKATVGQASAAWMTEQNARIKAANESTEAAKAAAAKPGVKTAVTGTGELEADAPIDGDVKEQFEAAVAAKVKAGKTKAQATSAVIHEQPELHQAYVQSHNQQHGRGRALAASRFA